MSAADDVALLLRRAGFGGSAGEIATLASGSFTAAVDHVLDLTNAPADVPPPELADSSKGDWERWVATTQWWLDRMATTATPIVEKMTLFWHGHFVSGNDKVPMTELYAQNALFRSAGLGNFRTLCQQMAQQPAMLHYLDNDSNVKGSPNLNFARELMELFTLGVGHYTEADILASARAWTGHGVNETTKTYEFHAAQHDNANKTFMGVTQNWNGPQIIDFICTDPATRLVMARFIAGELWAFFAAPGPPPSGVVEALADVFIANNLEIVPLLRALFLRPEFLATSTRQGLVRTPIEWVVAVMRATGLTAAQVNPQWYLDQMGQRPFEPPNVSGWRPNGYWLSTTAVTARAEFARNVAYHVQSSTTLLATTSSKTVTTAIDDALVAFGIATAASPTRTALISWLQAQRSIPYSGWAEQTNLVTLVALAPELQLA